MNKSEQRIQSEILIEVNKLGHRLFRSNAGKVQLKTGAYVQLFPKGFPDTCGWHKQTGQFIAIEVKTKTGKLSDDQKRFAAFAETQPIIYGVARSAEEAVNIIKGGQP